MTRSSINIKLQVPVNKVCIKCFVYHILLYKQIKHVKRSSKLGLVSCIVPFSCAKRLASRNVTSRSPSRSRLLPTRIMTMLGLASVLASLSQLPSALKVSRLNRRQQQRYDNQSQDNKDNNTYYY